MRSANLNFVNSDTVETFILARHEILAGLSESGSSRNQSGHLVSGEDS